MDYDKLTFKEIISGKGSFHKRHSDMKKQAQRIFCRDGNSISVQASEYHYCAPRNNYGPYIHVEVGFPSVKPPDSWKYYAEDETDPTGTVYSFIPVELVQEFIDLHGGEEI